MPYTDRQKRLDYGRAWNKKYYQANKLQERQRVAIRKQALVDWFAEYKSHLSCLRCGENEPVCLDFHHRKGVKKDKSLGDLKALGWGKKRVEQELQKCVVLCANCHRKEHLNK